MNNTLLEDVTKAQKFVYNVQNGILIKTIPKILDEKPEISVVIPTYNTEYFINRAILSIQNQNISNYEIIVINDGSTDNTYSLLQKVNIRDKRIKILNNIKNMGSLYSRCIGTMISKGKYIYPFDSDDRYLIDDILYSTYNELTKNKSDILEFRGISSKSIENFFNKTDLKLFRGYIKFNLIINQPTIAENSYKVCVLHALAINSSLYKEIINKLDKQIFYEHISYMEDCIVYYILVN